MYSFPVRMLVYLALLGLTASFQNGRWRMQVERKQRVTHGAFAGSRCSSCRKTAQLALRANEDDKEESDDVSAREAEFQDVLNSMLGEAQDNIAKKNIDMNSAETMMAALAEAKKLNLTEEEAAEEERKAVEEFSESFMEFIDGMVKVEGDDDDSATVSFADAFGGSPPIEGAIDAEELELPTGPLSMSEALTMLAPLRSTLSVAEWDETLELLEEVSPEERFDICSFMVRARMRPVDEE